MSDAAAGLATQNLNKLELAERATVIRSDWVNWPGWGDADLILSNTPYVRTDVIPTLDRTVRAFDPISALDGGEDGLVAYRSLARCAQMMKSGASLVLEIGFDQADDVAHLLEQAGLEHISVSQDLNAHDRVVSARQPMQ